MSRRWRMFAACLAGMALQMPAGAQSFQWINHIPMEHMLPVPLDSALLPAGTLQATNAAGQPLTVQRMSNAVYVGMRPDGPLTTVAFTVFSGAGTSSSPWTWTRTTNSLSIQGPELSATLADGGPMKVQRGSNAFTLSVGAAGAWQVKQEGALALEAAGTNGVTARFFAAAPHFELTLPSGTNTPIRISAPPASNGILRLMLSHKCGVWGMDVHVDDLENFKITSYKITEFDWFFPFDWAALESRNAALAMLPSSSAWRLNAHRVSSTNWEISACSLANYKNASFDSWHPNKSDASAPERRFSNQVMEAWVTLGFAFLDTNIIRAGVNAQLRALPALVAQASGSNFAGALAAYGRTNTVQIVDRNTNHLADLWGDRWIWTAGTQTNLIMDFAGQNGSMATTRVFAGYPTRRTLSGTNEFNVPRLTLTSRRHDGQFCDGSLLFGGPMSDGYLAYDYNLSSLTNKDSTGNYELTSFDLDGDGDLDVLYMPNVNSGIAGATSTNGVPQFFGGEAGVFVDLADRSVQFGINLDPLSGYCLPIFNSRYVSAGDTLTHFWSLNRTLNGWWRTLDNCLLGGHDWPQAVMDLSNDGFADVRFYTEGFAWRPNPAQPLSFSNVEFRCNPVRWTINLDANNNGVTTDPQANYNTAEMARNWDVCLYGRRTVEPERFRAELAAQGPDAIIQNYECFTNLYPSVLTDPWGNWIGVTGPNQPPKGWRGERVSYFNPSNGVRTGWGTGLDWLRTNTHDCVTAVYTDYDCANKYAPESTHPGIGNMNRVDVDGWGRADAQKYRLYFSPVTGRLHLRGADMGFDLTSELVCGNPVNTGVPSRNYTYAMAYQYWIYAISPDTFITGQWYRASNSAGADYQRARYYDRDNDGYFDTYVVQRLPRFAHDPAETVFQTLPLETIQTSRPTAFGLSVADDNFTGFWTTNLDFRSASLLPDTMSDYRKLNQLTIDTQNVNLMNGNRARLAGNVTLTSANGMPLLRNVTRPAFFLRQARPLVLLDAWHGDTPVHWTNWSCYGFAAAKSAFLAQGADCQELRTPVTTSALANVDVFLVPSMAAQAFTDAELLALRDWVAGGGRLLLSLPDSREDGGRFAPLLADYGVTTNGAFSTVDALMSGTNPLYYVQRGNLVFRSDPAQPSDLRDVSGVNLFFPTQSPGLGIDQLNIRAGRLLGGGLPLLEYQNNSFVNLASYGAGAVLVVGTPDFFNNMCVSTALNIPRVNVNAVEVGWNPYQGSCSSALMNRFAGGVVVRDNLIRLLLENRTCEWRTDGNSLVVQTGRPAELWVTNTSPLQVHLPGPEQRAGFSVWPLPAGSFRFSNLFTSPTASVDRVATLYLSGLDPAFDGLSKPVTATTMPAGVNVVLTYAGSTNPPVNAGAYAVTGRVEDVGYYGFITATLTVHRAAPAIAWTNPLPVASGTALGPVQLNATSPVPGQFIYAPPAGTIMTPGTGRVLNAFFAPADAQNYTSATAQVRLTVHPIIVASAGTHGSVYPAGSVVVPYGSDTQFITRANLYYLIGSLQTNGAPVAAANGQTVYTTVWRQIVADGRIAVNFAEQRAPAFGTPFWWLAQYGLTNGGLTFAQAETNDADADTFANWQEYVTVTDPTNAASWFGAGMAPAPNGFVLRWSNAPERVYMVQSQPDLRARAWSNAAAYTATTTGVMNFTNPAAAGTQFLRVGVTTLPAP